MFNSKQKESSINRILRIIILIWGTNIQKSPCGWLVDLCHFRGENYFQHFLSPSKAYFCSVSNRIAVKHSMPALSVDASYFCSSSVYEPIRVCAGCCRAI